MIKNKISELAVGYNKGWKQEVTLGTKVNQNFVQIPYLQFVNMLKYKCELNGIKFHLITEEYTSKCSALDKEPIEKHLEYKGKRIKRGLFKTSKGKLLNADVNGSLNIGRKVFGDGYISSANRGLVVNPVKYNT